MWGGAVLGGEWERMLGWLSAYGRVVTVALSGVLAALWIRRRSRLETARRAKGERRDG